jgi:hypothetical protein
MMGTGCSGSKFETETASSHMWSTFNLANAVRYGTAKAEWFLNAVGFVYSLL